MKSKPRSHSRAQMNQAWYQGPEPRSPDECSMQHDLVAYNESGNCSGYLLICYFLVLWRRAHRLHHLSFSL